MQCVFVIYFRIINNEWAYYRALFLRKLISFQVNQTNLIPDHSNAKISGAYAARSTHIYGHKLLSLSNALQDLDVSDTGTTISSILFIVTRQLKGLNNGARRTYPVVGNGSVNTYHGNGYTCYSKDVGGGVLYAVRTESNHREKDMSCGHELPASEPPSSEDVSTEAKEYPLLKAVTS